MQEPEIIHPEGRDRTAKPVQNWFGAYMKFLGSSSEHHVLKLMPLVLLGIIPISIADDLLLPVFGVIDDLPTLAVAIVVFGMTLIRVRKYRIQ